jgi:hypothetical protein
LLPRVAHPHITQNAPCARTPVMAALLIRRPAFLAARR